MKDYVESVTNLVRTTKKYVPEELFGKLLRDYNTLSASIVEDMNPELEELEAYDKMATEVEDYMDAAEKQAVTLYVTDLNKMTTERHMDICPYCGDKMILQFGDKPFINNDYHSMQRHKVNNADYVCFKCYSCGAKSPSVGLNVALLNVEKVKDGISKYIERVTDELNSSDYDDEKGEE